MLRDTKVNSSSEKFLLTFGKKYGILIVDREEIK